MCTLPRPRLILLLTGMGAAALLVAILQLPALGAGGLLHPLRRPVTVPAPAGCEEATFAGAGVTLKGWRCSAVGTRRGTLVYLHGVADNRTSGTGVVERFVPRGFDVVAYDSRAHGESGGDTCTYGYFEKADLERVLDTVVPGPIVLIGTSLGGAVALQQTARDRRVTAVVAAEVFSDLRTIASERAPFFFTAAAIDRAFRIAEARARFQVDAVSPVVAASGITAPVLLVHGDADRDTPPEHSRRVLEALAGSRQLLLVPGARHNGSLTGDVWSAIEDWIDGVLGAPSPVPGPDPAHLRVGRPQR